MFMNVGIAGRFDFGLDLILGERVAGGVDTRADQQRAGKNDERYRLHFVLLKRGSQCSMGSSKINS
jgi:hypothetical protein